MKVRAKHHHWVAIAAVLAATGGGIYWYEKTHGATTLAAGAMTVATPSNGQAALALPSGAQSWNSAAYLSLSGGTAVLLTVPTAAGTHLVTQVQKGAVLTVMWSDKSGVTQTTIVTFS